MIFMFWVFSKVFPLITDKSIATGVGFGDGDRFTEASSFLGRKNDF